MIDITDESYESDLSEEESNKLLLMCGHAVGPHLSPAAQAVLDAALPVYDDEYLYVAPMEKHAGMIAAAALHAAADAIAPVENELIDDHWYEKKNPVREQLLAIAHELEGQ